MSRLLGRSLSIDVWVGELHLENYYAVHSRYGGVVARYRPTGRQKGIIPVFRPCPCTYPARVDLE